MRDKSPIEIKNGMVPILINRICSCGFEFRLATSYRMLVDGKLGGIYVECPKCHSTIFVPSVAATPPIVIKSSCD